MASGEYAWLAPLVAFLVPAIGWGFREYWQRRSAKRQASHDASTTLKERKALLEEMISRTEDTSFKQTLTTQLEEVNYALLGLYSQRLRKTLKDAGFPPEEMLVAGGRSRMQPKEVSRLREVVAEINTLPPFLSIEVLRVLGNAYYYMEQYQDARNIYDKILTLNPYDQIVFRYRGAVYSHMKKDNEALNDYNRAVELNPDDYAALNDRGVSLVYLKRYEEALADFNHALEIKPDHPIVLRNRATVFTYLKRYDEALADNKRSLELKPDDAETLYNLACLFSLWGKTNNALTYLEKAIDKVKKYREDAKPDKDFDNIRDDPRFNKLIELD